MKRRSSFALLFALVASLVVALSGPLVAQAESQAGGLPDVAARVSALEAAVTSLQIANTNLQNALNAESAARTAGDSALQNALNGESAARAAGDSALQAATSNLQSALNAESAARTAGDSALQNALNAESAARAAGDSALQAAISTAKAKAFQTSTQSFGLVNGAEATVATLGPLPPGKYFVIAKASVENLNHDANWICALDLDNAISLDLTREGTDESATTDTTVEGTSNGNLANISLTTVFAPSGTVRMKCHTDVSSSNLSDIRIIAIEVGDFTNL